ncbi:hypothetical protein FQV39_25255 [Bosea sp. F3-2]|uniref:hypothetical protein n=1 Tax=Bosea sp. F3-2 TaxID=2599640 RepID=UPI0011F00CC3|nr:hypothetical protein [Bosea sp. F3-2]QEL25529.1 hypothetical protein FQV39_25255 [Bosea sp. F3-2]
MIENEYLDLPDDPEEAFAVLHRRKIERVRDAWNDSGANHSLVEEEYVDSLIAFDQVHDLGLLIGFSSPPVQQREFSDFFSGFRRHCEIISQKILMESARRAKASAASIVVFDAETKKAIHLLIQGIREKLIALDLTEAKREALFKKLNAFALEVDNNRTRADALYAFAYDVAKNGRKIAEEVSPILDVVDRISDLIDKAKKLKDLLPPWSERKRIEPPPKRIEGPGFGRARNTADDDIPF